MPTRDIDIQTKDNWAKIRTHFSKSFVSSLHVAIASVDEEQKPSVTPIGTFFLNKNQTGFFFEKYTRQLPKYASENKNVCVLGVNSGILFWLKSLFIGKFKYHPAIKLYGTYGERRKATSVETRALKRRMRFTKRLKGHQILWDDMTFVREINFYKAEKMNIGKMTNHL